MGVRARDQVRRVLYELFMDGEGTEQSQAAGAADRIENALLAATKIPKSRQYRDKALQVQLKVKGKGQAAQVR